MFASENTVEMGKNKSKCKLCKEIMKDEKVFGHFEKKHSEELEVFASQHQDFMDDEFFGGLDETEMFKDLMLSGMMGGGGKGKNNKKK